MSARHMTRSLSFLSAMVLLFGTASLSLTPADAKTPDPVPAFTTESYPRVDGTLSTQPLSAAFQRAFTGEAVASSEVAFHSADEAYENLIKGRADLVLAPAPSADDVALAKAAGVEFETILVADDAFVFLTASDNPVDSLTLAQLRQVYSGAITDWSKLGGPAGPIAAYQLPPGSASQKAMLDLVMRGAPMMDAPTTQTDAADAMTLFDGQKGAVGYSYGNYVSTVWGDLAQDGIKLMRVDGIPPTPTTIRSQSYPLSTAYYAVMKKSEPKNSSVRALVEQMASAQGQGVVQQAGYVAVGPADPVASPETSELGQGGDPVASLDQTYQSNPVTVSTTVEYVTAESGSLSHCASIGRATVTGLRSTETQNKIMAELRDRQDDFLKDLWGVDRLVAGQSCGGTNVPDIALGTSVTANFGNVISLVSSWEVPGRPGGAHDPAATVTMRLDTGQDLSFADVFTKGANIAGMIHAEALSSDPSADEQQIMSWIDDYATHPDRPFTFSAASATLYLPGASNGKDAGVVVSYSPRWKNVAIFNLASSATGLYSSAGPQTICPVLTYQREGYCWGADPLVGTTRAPYSGTVLDLAVDLDEADEWRVLNYSDGFGKPPAPDSGTGPMSMRLEVSANPSAEPRDLVVDFQTTNPQTLRADEGMAIIHQAGRTVPAIPKITTANASVVAGSVGTPVEPSTTLTLAWPDGSVADPIRPGADGTWSIPTPPGMASGPVHATAHNDQGDSISANSSLDASTPTPPAISTANATILAGTTDVDTDVTVTWPDGSVVVVARGDDGRWSAPVPESMASGQVSAVAEDLAGNQSGPSRATLDVDPPGKPVVTRADPMTIVGTIPADPGVTLWVTWPDGTTSKGLPTNEDGTWSIAVPSLVLDNGGRIQIMAEDAAGNVSEQTRFTVGKPIVDPAHSVLSVISDPVEVVTDPCSGQTTTTPDTLTATVAVVDTVGRPVPEAVVAFSTTDGMMLTQQYVTADDGGLATVMAVMDQTAILAGARPVLSATILIDGEQVPVSGSGLRVPVTVSFPPAPRTAPMATVSPTEGSLVPADNSSTYTVDVEWIDGCGVPLAGQPVTFTADGYAKLTEDSVRLDADGRAQIMVRDPVAETVVLHGSSVSTSGDQVDVRGLDQMVFAPAVPDPVQSAMSAAESLVSIPCDAPGATTVTVMVKDKDGHPLYRQPVSFSASGDATLQESTAVTDEQGRASVSLVDEVPETVTVTAALEDGEELTGSPMVVSFAPGCAPPSPSSIWFSVSQGPKVADGEDAYTVTIYARDVNGGPVKGIAGQFEVTEGTGTVAVSDVVDHSDGTYTSQLSSSQAGDFSVRVTMGSPDSHRDLANSPALLTFLPAWSARLDVDVSTDPSSATAGAARAADGQDAYVVTAHISAKAGKSAPAPLVGQAPLMALSLSGSDADQAEDVAMTDFVEEQPGVYTATVSSTVPGRYSLVVSWLEAGEELVSSEELPVGFVAAGADSDSVAPGARTTITGEGFEPGEQVAVSMDSFGMDLGTATADETGVVALEFTVPATTEPGAQSVSVRGEASGTVDIPLTVAGATVVVATGGQSDPQTGEAWTVAVACLVVAVAAGIRRLTRA